MSEDKLEQLRAEIDASDELRQDDSISDTPKADTLSKSDKNLKKLGNDSIKSLVLSISFPTAISFTVSAIYQIVDSVFVGMLGEDELAALSICSSLQILIMSVASALTHGSTPLISLELGKNTEEGLREASRILSHAIAAGVFCSVIVIPCITYPLLRPLLVLVGASGDTLDLCMSYCRVMCTVYPLTHFLSSSLGPVLRVENRAKRAMVLLLVSCLLNGALDPFWIFTLRLGFPGAMVSSLFAATCVAVLILSFYFGRFKQSSMSPALSLLKPFDFGLLKQILGLGLGIMGISSLASIVMMVSNKMVAKWGGQDTSLWQATLGVTYKIIMLLLMPLMAMSSTLVPIMGYNIGSERHDRVFECLSIVSNVSAIFAILFETVILIFAPQIATIFTESEELTALIVRCLRVMVLGTFLAPFPSIIGSLFQMEKKILYCVIFLSVGRFGLQLLLLLAMSFFEAGDPMLVIYVFVLCETVVSIPGFVVYLLKRRSYRVRGQEYTITETAKDKSQRIEVTTTV